MHLSYGYLIETTWFVWALYWAWSARGVKAVAREDGLLAMLIYRLPVVLGFALLFTLGQSAGAGWLYRQLLSAARWAPLLGWLLVLLGLGFASWARLVLGRNWSGTVQLKQDHELIEAGPYRWVRHPIYTGLLWGYWVPYWRSARCLACWHWPWSVAASASSCVTKRPGCVSSLVRPT